MPVFLSACAAALATCALLLYVCRSPLARVNIAPRTAVFAITGVVLVGLTLVLWPALLKQLFADQNAGEPPTPPGMPVPVGARAAPLAAGEPAPPLAAAGWINGVPRTEGARLIVLDIWALW
jgi:hypothetical protein